MRTRKEASKESIMHFASAYREDIFDGIGDKSRLPLAGRYATFDGIDDYIDAPHLVGTETVISVQGTVNIANITISAKRIDIADAGTIWNLILSDGTHYSFDEGSGVLINNIGSNKDATVFTPSSRLVNINNTTFWHTDGTIGQGNTSLNLAGYSTLTSGAGTGHYTSTFSKDYNSVGITISGFIQLFSIGNTGVIGAATGLVGMRSVGAATLEILMGGFTNGTNKISISTGLRTVRYYSISVNSGGNYTVYVDGNLHSQDILSAPNLSFSNLQLYTRSSTTQRLTGSASQLAYFEGTLDYSEHEELFQKACSNSIETHSRFSDCDLYVKGGDQGVAIDYSNNNITFTLVGTNINTSIIPLTDSLDYRQYTGQVHYPIQVKENCLHNNGVTQNITKTITTNTSRNWSIKIQVKLDETTTINDDRIFSIHNSISGDRFLFKRESSDSPNADCIQLQNKTETLYSASAIDWSDWVQLDIFITQTTPYVAVYVNKELITFSGTFVNETLSQGIDTVCIMRWYTSPSSQILKGFINNFCLVDEALSLTELNRVCKSGSDSLIIKYPLTEGSGTTVYDISGNANHGVISNPDLDCWDYFQYEYSNNHRGYNNSEVELYNLKEEWVVDSLGTDLSNVIFDSPTVNQFNILRNGSTDTYVAIDLNSLNLVQSQIYTLSLYSTDYVGQPLVSVHTPQVYRANTNNDTTWSILTTGVSFTLGETNVYKEVTFVHDEVLGRYLIIGQVSGGGRQTNWIFEGVKIASATNQISSPYGPKIPCSLFNHHYDVLGNKLIKVAVGGKYMREDLEFKLNPYDSPEIYNITSLDSLDTIKPNFLKALAGNKFDFSRQTYRNVEILSTKRDRLTFFYIDLDTDVNDGALFDFDYIDNSALTRPNRVVISDEDGYIGHYDNYEDRLVTISTGDFTPDLITALSTRGSAMFGYSKVFRVDIDLGKSVESVVAIQNTFGIGVVNKMVGYADYTECVNLNYFACIRSSVKETYLPVRPNNQIDEFNLSTSGDNLNLEFYSFKNFRLYSYRGTQIKLPTYPKKAQHTNGAFSLHSRMELTGTLDLSGFTKMTSFSTGSINSTAGAPYLYRVTELIMPTHDEGVYCTSLLIHSESFPEIDISGMNLRTLINIRGNVLTSLTLPIIIDPIKTFSIIYSRQLNYEVGCGWHIPTHAPNLLNVNSAIASFIGLELTSSEVDNLLIDLASIVSSEPSGGSYTGRRIKYVTTNSARTAASDDAVITLQDKNIILE